MSQSQPQPRLQAERDRGGSPPLPGSGQAPAAPGTGSGPAHLADEAREGKTSPETVLAQVWLAYQAGLPHKGLGGTVGSTEMSDSPHGMCYNPGKQRTAASAHAPKKRDAV